MAKGEPTEHDPRRGGSREHHDARKAYDSWSASAVVTPDAFNTGDGLRDGSPRPIPLHTAPKGSTWIEQAGSGPKPEPKGPPAKTWIQQAGSSPSSPVEASDVQAETWLQAKARQGREDSGQ